MPHLKPGQEALPACASRLWSTACSPLDNDIRAGRPVDNALDEHDPKKGKLSESETYRNASLDCRVQQSIKVLSYEV
eukprot:2067207-Amphidinium_carterae.1